MRFRVHATKMNHAAGIQAHAAKLIEIECVDRWRNIGVALHDGARDVPDTKAHPHHIARFKQ